MPSAKKALQFLHLKSLFLLISVLASAICFSQQTVSGRITDSASSQGLSNINVTVKGTGRGTTTDANGNFRIAASQGDVLVISAVNYAQQEVAVGNSATVATILLSSRNSQLSEVVVIGYGQRQRKDVKCAVSQVGAR